MAVDKRLLLINTSVSYLRTLITIGFSLFATRWLMNALGVEDYGLYFVVGGLIVCLTFINTALSSGSQRFFSHAMDTGVIVVRKWFTTSFYIHMGCVVLVLFLAVPLFFLFFAGGLAIPQNRYGTCVVVYWSSVLVACGGIANVPFVAMYTAKQRIFELTIMQLVYTFANFALTYALFYVNGDRLLIYTLMVMTVNYVIFIIQGVRSFCIFKEARLVPVECLNKHDFREMLSFSWWTFLDSFAFMLRGQAIQIVFNRFGSAGLNAAYSVSNQLAGQTNVLSGALTGAMSPGIMSLYGAGDKVKAGQWSLRTCRLATILALLIFVPLFVECDTVVRLWLGKPPEYTVEFVRVMAVMYLVTQFVTGGNTLIRARGNIGVYEILVSVSYLSAIGLALVIVFCGWPTQYAIVGYLVSTVGYALVTIAIATRCPGFGIWEWTRRNLVPGLTVLCVALFMGFAMSNLMERSLLRCLIVGGVASMCVCLLSWILLLTRDERKFILGRLHFR